MKVIRFAGLSTLLIALCIADGAAQSGTITTYAGHALPTMGKDATTQSIDAVAAIPDGSDGIYVASSQNRIFHVSKSGRLAAFAGTGMLGFAGNGGPAASAQLHSPRAMALDAAGNLFIADEANHRVRKVNREGIISTIAGDGTLQLGSSLGIAVDAIGNLFVADSENNVVRKVAPAGIVTTVVGNGIAGFSGDGGPAGLAQINTPRGITFDTAGNLFIADSGNNRVRKVTTAGFISTIAGEGSPAMSERLESPRDVAVDATSNLFIADANNGIRKIARDGVISSIPAAIDCRGCSSYVRLGVPDGISVDAAGNLLVTIYASVIKIPPSGFDFRATVAGNNGYGFSGDGGPAAQALLESTGKLAADTYGNLFFADARNNRVRKITPAGIISTVAGNGQEGFSGDGGRATSAKLNQPQAVAVDASGNIFIADTENHRVRKVSPAGIISTVAGNGDDGSHPSESDGKRATAVDIETPVALAIDMAGNLFILSNDQIHKVTSAGVISTVAGTTTYDNVEVADHSIRERIQPEGIAVDSGGNLFIADSGNNRIRKVSPDGIVTAVAGNGTKGFSGDGSPATSGQLGNPMAVAVDRAGNLYIADYSNNRIRKVSRDGIITTAAGSGSSEIGNPMAVAVDGAGNLFIPVGSRILKVTPVQ